MGTVYARRNDLLGGMLMNMAHAWGFARKTGRQLVLNWIDDYGERHIPWGELFTAAPFQVVTDREMAEPTFAHAMPRVPQSSVSLAQYPAIFYVHTTWVQIDYEARVASELRIRELLAGLTIHPAITDAIAGSSPPFTAVHIRRGADITDILAGDPNAEPYQRAASSFVKRYADLEAYRMAVEATGNGAVMIFSNDAAEADRLRRMLRGRPHLSLPTLAHLTPSQRDFAEMLLMARATQIIGTRSNYSSFPRLWGNIPVILAHRWISQTHLQEFVRRTVPAQAQALVLENYRKLLNRQAT